MQPAQITNKGIGECAMIRSPEFGLQTALGARRLDRTQRGRYMAFRRDATVRYRALGFSAAASLRYWAAATSGRTLLSIVPLPISNPAMWLMRGNTSIDQ